MLIHQERRHESGLCNIQGWDRDTPPPAQTSSARSQGLDWQWVPYDQGKQAPIVPFSPHSERSAGWRCPMGAHCEGFPPQMPGVS